MQRKNGYHTATRLQMKINVKDVVTINKKLFIDRGFRARPIQDSGNKVIAHCSSNQVHVTVHRLTVSKVSHSIITFATLGLVEEHVLWTPKGKYGFLRLTKLKLNNFFYQVRPFFHLKMQEKMYLGNSTLCLYDQGTFWDIFQKCTTI